ncbi:MAG TPA: hypothetical protein VGO17_14115 [Aurantimonas sp.]|jgi:predicted DNA-binding transcriptional regulator AlpA|nr:hypothetical protein [Aurantimonas sp.]
MGDINSNKMAFSVRQFCARNGISTPTYYKLRASKRGPREMRFGSVVRISIEAEADWRRAREYPDMEERARIEQQRRKLKQRSSNAVKNTVHVASAAGR